MKQYLFILSLSLIFFACKDGQKEKNDQKETLSLDSTSCKEVRNNNISSISQDKEITSSLNKIFGEEIELDVILHPARIQIGDSLLYISCFNCDTMIYTFNLPDMTLLNSFGCKGSGPDDFLFPTFCNSSNNTVSLWGYSNLKKVTTYKVNKTGKWEYIKEYKLEEDKPYNQLYFINNTFYYNEFPPELTIRKIDIENQNNNKDYKFKMNEKKSDAFFMNNKGDLVVSNNGIAYLYYYKNQIDFFDLDFNLINTRKADNHKEYINKNNPNESIIYYISHYGGEKHLYTINLKDSKMNMKDECSNLEVYDWKGNHINSYCISPAVNLFVVDKKNEKLYGYNYNMPNSIFVYNIANTIKTPENK